MSILVNVKKVANNSLQGELSDTIVKEDGVNVLALLNKGDHRFKVGSTRRTWFPITPESMLEMGIPKTIVDSASNLEEGGIVELNLENPKIEGLELRIQVEETVIPNSYQRQNTMKTAKQIMIDEKVAKSRITTDFDLKKYLNKNGYFLDENGQFIFTNTVVKVQGQVSHRFIPGRVVPETELANYGATLAEKEVTSKELVD